MVAAEGHLKADWWDNRRNSDSGVGGTNHLPHEETGWG